MNQLRASEIKYKRGKHPQTLKKEKRATILFVLFFFQFGLLLPFTPFLAHGILISVFTIVLTLYAFVHRMFHINRPTILLFCIPLLSIVAKLPFEYDAIGEGGDVGIQFLIGFLTIGISGILFGTTRCSASYFCYVANKVAWVNFLLIGFIPFTSLYGGSDLSINYMKYGYAILPVVLIAYTNISRGHTSIAQWGLFLCSLLSMIVFGARGAQLTFVLFFLVSFLFLSRVRFIWKLLISVVILIGVFALPYLLTQLISILDQYGISSYPIAKYKELLSGTDFIDTSSGRNFLYEYAFLRILERPLLGNPFNSCYVDTGGDFYYYHNVFLDLLVNYGVFITGVLVVLLVYVLWSIFTRGTLDETYLIAILFVVPLGRLMVSSSFWLRPEFWLFLSYSINTFILQQRRRLPLSAIRYSRSRLL